MKNNTIKNINTIDELAKFADYSFLNTLVCDPLANKDGQNHNPREVFNGHYVPVTPTAIKDPIYITHSKTFFKELGLDDSLAKDKEFIKMFSGDTSNIKKPLKNIGWATGYALSIYGTEYYMQCPFQTGNGYGDGRAISILEAVINKKRWEFQLKGAGRTPYCRGADGRAVLRSSIREFLAQEHMFALGVPTSRSLSLYTSKTETVTRPWFNENSYSRDPERMIEENVAISTRVAPSFIRVGQFELFGRRARKKEHPKALEELEELVLHGIKREYQDEIEENSSIEEKVILLALKFRERLTSLVSNWIRVGYCQGNFNSDNTAVGGFTLDFGPFGFIDIFDPEYQPWTGGGLHFSFFNQAEAARKNFNSFCSALMPLLETNQNALENLVGIRSGFEKVMNEKMEKMWTSKLGLEKYDDKLFNELMHLMLKSEADYTIFFRELSSIPKDISSLEISFYRKINDKDLQNRWNKWLENWKSKLSVSSEELKTINPKYSLKEWFLVEAYEKANDGDYSLILELQEVMTNPYLEQSKQIEEKYYVKKPINYFGVAGISHITCSS